MAEIFNRQKEFEKITTLEMELAIAEFFGLQRMMLIVPRVSDGLDIHECDMFIVRKSKYASEVEIKISMTDLKKDFKKKHGHVDVRIKDFYYAIPHYIYEKALDYIPPHAGLFVCRRSYDDSEVHANMVKSARSNKFARKLNQNEIYKIAKLGTMKTWNLHKKLIRSYKE